MPASMLSRLPTVLMPTSGVAILDLMLCAFQRAEGTTRTRALAGVVDPFEGRRSFDQMTLLCREFSRNTRVHPFWPESESAGNT